MEGLIMAQGEVLAKLVPGGVRSLAHLSDEDLVANTRRLVGRSNQLFAALLVHLAEVDARGLHRTRRCASLYTSRHVEQHASLLRASGAANKNCFARPTPDLPISL